MSDQKDNRYSPDIIRNYPFQICSWVFPLWYIEDKLLVNCGCFPGDCKNINGMRSDFICSEDKEGLLKVIADTLMSMEVILFKLLALISLIVFSYVDSGSNIAASKLFI